jgi:hypothetical protein
MVLPQDLRQATLVEACHDPQTRSLTPTKLRTTLTLSPTLLSRQDSKPKKMSVLVARQEAGMPCKIIRTLLSLPNLPGINKSFLQESRNEVSLAS